MLHFANDIGFMIIYFIMLPPIMALFFRVNMPSCVHMNIKLYQILSLSQVIVVIVVFSLQGFSMSITEFMLRWEDSLIVIYVNELNIEISGVPIWMTWTLTFWIWI